MTIRKLKDKDLLGVTQIYNYYIENSTATFEEVSISREEMKSRADKIQNEGLFLVAEEDEQIIGYAYASNWNSRCAYRSTKETSVYLNPQHIGKGVGSKLYESILAELRNRDIHVVIGGISLPNEASVGLHEKMGYQKVAHFREVGFKFGQWIDVGYWELIL